MMAVELMMGYNNRAAKMEEAASAGLESVEHLVRLLTERQQHQQMKEEEDYRAVADVAVVKFRKMVSLLDRPRTGHARFRRAPVTPQQAVSLKSEKQSIGQSKRLPQNHLKKDSICFSEEGETSMSSGFQFTNMTTSQNTRPSCGKPPLSLKRKCCSSMDRCHCSNKNSKRKAARRVVRIPAISLKMADIPPDEYSWRKYEQKPIKGSPHPRGYYKCSSVRGCPARKHVERALDDPTQLIVTYDGEHNHNIFKASAAAIVVESS